MKLVLRGSEYQDFLTCRKKWQYGWVEKITPKRPNNKLFIGTIFHKWLEEYYNNGCNKILADLLASSWMLEQDVSGMEQTEIDDMKKLVRGMAENYDKKYHDNDSQWKILATELEFLIKLEDGMYFTGTIDLVYELDGKIRFTDHKTVSSISQYEEKSKMDRQISRYWWALKMISAGIGLVKNAQGKWVQMDSLLGKDIDGFDYNLILKDVPKQPEVLKKGGLSKAKNQRTTYELYHKKIIELDLDVADYVDILDILRNKPDPYLKRVNVRRNEQELESAIWEFLYTANDIGVVRDLLTTGMEHEDVVTYRNIGQHCDHMCQFKTLCQTTIEGGNVSLVRNLAYIKNPDRIEVNTDEE